MKREPTIAIGWTRRNGQRVPYEVPLRNIMGSHWIVLGRTGTGKTGVMNGIVTNTLLRHPECRIVVTDLKGEACGDLLSTWLPVLSRRHPHVRPENVTTIALWDDEYCVPLNILAKIEGLDRDLHAASVCLLFEAFLGEKMGSRMRPILSACVQAVMEVGGSLVHVLRIVEDESFRLIVARHIADPELRHYLEVTFSTEPSASISALRTRIGSLLGLKRIRNMLSSSTCISGPQLISAPLTLIHAGNPPLGQSDLSTWLAAWLFHLLCTAIMSRTDTDTPLLCCVDEFQRIVHGSGEDLQIALQQSRYRGAAFHLYSQSLDQIRHPGVVQTLLTNSGMLYLLSPRANELNLISHMLPMATGRLVDHGQPDRVLSRSEEEQFIHRRLLNLKDRQGVVADVARRTCVTIEQTMNLPYEEVRAEAATLPRELIRAFWRGRYGLTAEEMRKTVAQPWFETTADHDDSPGSGREVLNTEEDSVPLPLARGGLRRRPRAAVVLP